MEVTEAPKKRWAFLAMACLVLMLAGLIYSWSNLSSPLKEFGWSETGLTFNYTLIIIFFSLGGVLSGITANKVPLSVRLIVSAVVLTAGFWLSSTLKSEDNIIKLYLYYGFLSGISVGVIFNSTVSSVSLWFPDKKGIANGIMLAGFGMGSFFISLISGRIMESGAMTWQQVYRMLGIIAGAVIAIGGIWLRTPSEKDKLPEPKSNGSSLTEVVSFTSAEMIRTATFVILFFALPIAAGAGNSVIGLAKTLLLSSGMAETAAILYSSLISIANGCGRLAAGTFVDKFGIKKSLIICCCIAIAGSFFTMLGVLVSAPVVATLGVFVCGFSYGFPSTLASTSSLEFFGPKYYSLNYGLLNFNSVICACIPTVVASISALGGSYTWGLAFLTLNCTLALIISLMLKRPVLKASAK